MPTDRIRLRIRCRGAVQGVGFRPTVHRVATQLGLAGWVINDPDGATAEVEGDRVRVAELVDGLPGSLPPLARLDRMEVDELPPLGERGFTVRDSQHGPRTGALVPPDAALCADCRRDMERAGDRRHRYPFTTCTNCGPRFSLVRTLPYDRERTAMACFPLCPHCRGEYTDPANRRFHAEPVCCPACGPRLWFADAGGTELAEGSAAIASARAALLDGLIVAVKGLGGFQLACRADARQPVELLRRRKRRPTKPFAVMVRDLEHAHRIVRLAPSDEELLASHRAPVMLAPRRTPSPLADGVAPGIEDIGVMLPTTPLHVELIRHPDVPPLVMTSGNRSEEPICRGNREALQRLGPIAHRFLLHDRDVVRRVDDSVVRSAGGGHVLVRRARGWVPEPLPLPAPAREPMLAVGGHLQVTACLGHGDQAFLSQHVGDLDSEAARGFLREVIGGLEEFLEVSATHVVADCHPDYPSTWLGRELAEARGARFVKVQHHLAHAAAVLAEHRAFPAPGQRAYAICLDGTGWGPDGSAWGGEWLAIDGELDWRRIAHLEALPLVGGERAVREPWRVAAAAIVRAGRGDLLARLQFAPGTDRQELETVARLARSGSWPMASGAGRLFEAGGALLGLTAQNSWEGEAAVRLESLAAGARGSAVWPEVELETSGPLPILPSSHLLVAAAERLLAGETADTVAAGLHATFCDLSVALTRLVAPQPRPTVALGGGCMVNRLLLAGLEEGLRNAGFDPLSPRRVPPGDGGLAYGQVALIAAAAAAGRTVAEQPSPATGDV